MPKKDKDKKQAHAAKKANTSDPLPQVWLPDQVCAPPGGGAVQGGWVGLTYSVVDASN